MAALLETPGDCPGRTASGHAPCPLVNVLGRGPARTAYCAVTLNEISGPPAVS